LESASSDRWLQWLSQAGTQFRHVGWHPLPFWLGRPASLSLAGEDGSTAASLLASPDNLGTAWLHLFAADSPPGAVAAWALLWPEAKNILAGMKLASVWAMATQPWLLTLLRGSGFADRGTVIAYCQRPTTQWPGSELLERIDLLREDDLPAVEALDRAAFDPPWQMDSEALHETLSRSLLAAAFRREGRIAGYCMAVATAHGVHLTRLAVDPRDQSRGIGRALTVYLLNYFHAQSAPWITVNTQSENRRSRRLYRSMGFKEMEESYPVLQFSLEGKS
jgi:[ribosomal protein S18]-alanine N-acetyltransferase